MNNENKVDSTTQNRYINSDGSLRWELMTEILKDVSGSYLSNIEGIQYKEDDGFERLFQAISDGGDVDDPDLLGSRLLKTISKMHGVSSEHSIMGENEARTLYRLSKFASVASKLSDKYAMQDNMYESQWHNDVLEICQAIVECNREVDLGDEYEQEFDNDDAEIWIGADGVPDEWTPAEVYEAREHGVSKITRADGKEWWSE